jgi:hypothetical protein
MSYTKKNRIYTIPFFFLEKNHEILATLQYGPLDNISRSEKWVKKDTRRGLNGTHTVRELSQITFALRGG